MTLAQGADGDHHLLGDHRRARRVAAAAGDAVADPRQLRGRGAEEGLRAGRRGGGDRRRGRAAARRLRHHLPVVARRLPARGRRHRRRAVRGSGSSGTSRTPGPAASTPWARCCRRSAWAASCSASWCGRRAASTSVVLIAVGARRARLARPLARAAQARGQADAARSRAVPADLFRLGISAQMLQNIALGGAMIALPIFLQMVLEYNALQTGLSLAPLSLTMFASALLAGKRAGTRRPASIIRAGFALVTVGIAAADPDRPARGLRLGARDPADDRRRGPRPAGLAAQQLHALADRRRARQRGGRRQLGRRLVRAVVRARVRRRDHARHALDRLHHMAAKAARCCRPPSSSRSPTRSRTTPRS